tara:strand:- start:1467 stop:3563 length:2097 start_codon:yes stop_codon:yes gene_type:complete
MANDKDFKVNTSIKPKRYLETLGTITSGTEGPSGTFSTTLYSGSGSNQDINTGIDLSGSNEGLVWTKRRDSTGDNFFFDTLRGTETFLLANSVNNEKGPSIASAQDTITAFNNNGFTTGSSSNTNNSAGTFLAWTFKSSANFFDIMTYTGNGSNRTISHNLGESPGMIITKRRNSTGNWNIFHRSLGASKYIMLHSSDGEKSLGTMWNNTVPTSTEWSLGTSANVNVSFGTYIAYVFGHNDHTVHCSSYTGAGSTDVTVTTGFEPQWIMIKKSSADGDQWIIFDDQRGIAGSGGNDSRLFANLDNSETTSTDYIETTSSGFKVTGTSGDVATDGATYIYMAIAKTADVDNLDLSTGSVFNYTPTASKKVKISNPAASGTNSGATLIYNGGTTASFDLANASYESKTLDVSSQTNQPAGLAFKHDGTRLFLNSGTIFQYDLTTPFDISTASVVSGSYTAGGSGGLVLSPDGTKLFYAEAVNDGIGEVALSTPFDLSTAVSPVTTFLDTQPQDGGTFGLCSNEDGTKFYMVGFNTDTVYQYNLTTGFDLTTASFANKSLSVSAQDNLPTAVAINTDGTKLFVLGTSDKVYQYNLSTPFDVSTGSFASVEFSVASQATGPQGLVFANSGTKMYVADTTNDSIFQYSVGSGGVSTTYHSSIKFSRGTAPTSPALGETDIITFDTTDGGTTYLASHAIDGAKK